MLLFDWICSCRQQREREIHPIERTIDANLVFHRLILLLELIALFDDLVHLLDEVLFALTKITLKFHDRVVERLKGKDRMFAVDQRVRTYAVFLFSFVTLFFEGSDDLFVFFFLLFQFVVQFGVQLFDANQFLDEGDDRKARAEMSSGTWGTCWEFLAASRIFLKCSVLSVRSCLA